MTNIRVNIKLNLNNNKIVIRLVNTSKCTSNVVRTISSKFSLTLNYTIKILQKSKIIIKYH